MSNKLSRFWQELKRRHVIRVIMVYTGAAFVILSLVDMIREPFELPNWSFKLVIIILIIGLIIAVILSWIYDVHPEGGMVKTEPADQAGAGNLTGSSKGWKIASYISFIVIVTLIVLNIIPRTNSKEILDKSIAVLPFRNDSPNQERMYFINGTMEAILDNLCKINDIRVVSRNSVEQYRNNPKPTPVVAEEMNVSYILEGSGHRDGNNVRLFIQLLDGQKDQHLWSKSYDADIEEIFTLQSEIAQLVAGEIEAIITPEEKQLIEKVPTTNLTAYDYYQRGKAIQDEEWSRQSSDRILQRVEDNYFKALEHDSTFALAYTGLAWVYYRKYYFPTFLTEDFLDSMLILANMALSFDPQLSEAFVFKGLYYQEHDAALQAIDEYKNALHYNPNEWLAYFRIGSLYESQDQYLEAIKNYYIAASLHRGASLPGIYRSIASSFLMTGFNNISHNIAKEALVLDNDSAAYYRMMCEAESFIGRFEDAVRYRLRAFAIDSTSRSDLLIIGNNYLFLGNFERAVEYYMKLYKKQVEMLKAYDYSDGEIRQEVPAIRLGQAYSLLGMEDEAKYYLNKSLEYLKKRKEMERAPPHSESHEIFVNALFYACLGDKEEAFEYLRLFYLTKYFPSWLVIQLKIDPAFTAIRDEPEFQQIVRDVETKFQAEHERVRQWLEENDML
jgi:TolB-like protein